ncbi:hypothetical protein PR048_014475 [Dryococelus australis]|uniref:Uncharacterized protein n=1 Tax=Dryococelus australis TaxID=614101 RepID=A0ABQ9HEC2_9NEOP|nr:hypothetical protein PR048_014475 [Dryococelus australis]
MVEDDDTAAAVTLRSISRKAYLYLRKNVGQPLPGLPTIRKLAGNLKCLPGAQKEVGTFRVERNNFLDYGIRLPCGTEVLKWQLQQILHDKELPLTPKLDSRVHLNVSDNVNRGNSEVGVEDNEDEPEEEQTQLADSLNGSDEEEALRYLAGYLAHCSKD